MTLSTSFTGFGLIESAVLLALLGGWFWWRLRPTHWFQAQRFMLLLLPGFALLVPMLQWSVALPAGTAAWPLLSNQLPQHLVFVFSPTSTVLTWGKVLLTIYWTGFGWSLLRSVMSIASVLAIVVQGQRQLQTNWIAVSHRKILQPASFFHYIFLPSAEPLNRLVLAHELVHVRQRHSWDVMLMEVWVAFFWFHPLIYRLRAALRDTHEFIADATVINQGSSAYSYAQVLIHYHQKNVPMPVHAFANRITQRLERLANPQGMRNSWREFVLMLPLICFLGGLFSVRWAQALPHAVVVEHWFDEVKALENQALLTVENAGVDPVTLDPQLVLSALALGADNQSFDGEIAYPSMPQWEANSLPYAYPDTIPVTPQRQLGVEVRTPTTLQPLIVVDGELWGIGANLNKINPDQIERIDVYKGQRAVELYGEDGRNGVVSITTKGKKNRKGKDAYLVEERKLGNSPQIQIDTVIILPQQSVASAHSEAVKPLDLERKMDQLMRQGLLVVNNQVLGPISDFLTDQFEEVIKSLDAQATFTINLDNVATEKFYGAAARNGVVVIRCSEEALRKLKALRK